MQGYGLQLGDGTVACDFACDGRLRTWRTGSSMIERRENLTRVPF